MTARYGLRTIKREKAQHLDLPYHCYDSQIDTECLYL
jgi:hypothetical protein